MAPENSQATGRVVEMQVSGLVGPALDWAVAKAVGMDIELTGKYPHAKIGGRLEGRYNPSSSWIWGGPLIGRFGIEFEWITDASLRAEIPTCGTSSFAGDHLIAAGRAIVAAHLGEVVSVPAELVENK